MQLKDYIVVVRKNWWLIVLTAVVTTVSALGFAKFQAPIYRSSVMVEVTGRLDYGTSLAINQQLRQLSNRLQTANLAMEVDRRFQFDLGPEKLRTMIHTQAFPDTITIQLDVDDTNPDRARQVARAFAEVFVERETAATENVPQQERRIVTMLDDPTPSRLHWPQTRVFLISGGLLGLILGVILAFARDYFDDSLKSVDDVERFLGVPTLATIPHYAGGARALERGAAARVGSRPARQAIDS